MCNKAILSIFFIFIFTFFLFAQEKTIPKNQVPAAVIDSFTKTYPNATVKRYAKETEHGKTYYEIESMEGQTHRDLLYEQNGQIAEIEESIPYDSLPSAIQDTITKRYERNAFVSAEKVTRPGKPLNYSVVLKHKGHKKEYSFNPDGTRVKGEEEMEEGNNRQGENEND